MESKKPKKGPNIFLVILVVILLIVLIPVLVLFIAGSSPVESGVPKTGVVPVAVPFSGNKGQLITIEWQVVGAADSVPTGVYYGPYPSTADFSKSPPPDQAGYEGFAPGARTESKNGKNTYQAQIPNAYALNYVRIYASIGDTNYWSSEFMIEP